LSSGINGKFLDQNVDIDTENACKCGLYDRKLLEYLLYHHYSIFNRFLGLKKRKKDKGLAPPIPRIWQILHFASGQFGIARCLSLQGHLKPGKKWLYH
jgi:hypothetical protein